MNDFFRQEAFPILKEGDNGSDVIILQQKLKVLGLYDASITGSFDYYTKLIVELFQKQNQLNVDGMVGVDTWELINTMTVNELRQESNYPTLRLGDTGEYVRILQTRLSNLMYYDAEITGVFDKTLENSVKAFQINNNLTADGIVGRFTWSSLETLYSPLAICDNNESTENTIYTVQKGDTLYSIARKYNITVDQLKILNNLSSNTISIGQQLTIPSPINTSNIIYTVMRGDTLYSIARKYNVTVDEIKNLNNLTNNTISINQQLLIPTTSNIKIYTVKSGDTLYSIAKRYNITVDEIKSLNNLSSNTLSIGQELKILK